MPIDLLAAQNNKHEPIDLLEDTQSYAPDMPLIPDKEIEELFKNIQQFAGPEIEKKARDAASIAATFNIPESTAFDMRDSFLQKMDTTSFWDKATGSFKAGWGDVYSSVGGIMKRKGLAAGDDYVDFGERLKRSYIPASDQSEFTYRKLLDPEYYATSVMRSVPFTLSLIPAMVIGAYAMGTAGAAMGLGLFGKTVLGALGGAALSRPIESAFEGQGAYEEAKNKDFTDDDAEIVANQVFWDNMKLTGLDATELATSFLPMGKVAGNTVKRTLGKRILAATGKTSAKVGAVGTMEMMEERYQEKAVMDAIGDPVSLFDFDNPRLNEAGAIGAIFGIGLAGTGSVWTALRDKVIITDNQKVKFLYDKTKKQALADGATVVEADRNALDTIAATPEGKAHIERVVGDLVDLANGSPEKEQAETKTVSDQPFIFGVNEDSNGEVTTFTMADPVSGETFDVPALKSEDKEKMTVIPDMDAVKVKIKELRSVDQTDMEIDKLIQGEEDIDQAVGRLFGETGMEDVPDFEEEARPETVVERVKQINERIGENGSIDLEPLINLGRSIWAEGHTSIEEFTARAKELLSDVWDKVKDLILQAWNVVNNERGSINIGNVTNKPGMANIPPETTRKAEGGENVIYTNASGEPIPSAILQRNSGDLWSKNPEPYYNIVSGSNLEVPIKFKTSDDALKWASDNGFKIVEHRWPNSDSEFWELEHRNTKAKLDEKISDLKNKWDNGIDVYIRYGKIPKNGKSYNAITGTYEQGVSVFKGRLLKNGEILISGDNHVLTASAESLRVGKPYIVEGDVVGLGNDGEPLLSNAKQLTIVQALKKYKSSFPSSTRPSEGQEQTTLYSGVDPTQIIPVLKSLTNNIKEAMPHLEALGLKAYESGKNTFEAWSTEMKSYLGDLWESFKEVMARVWESVKKINEQLGERGSFSTKKEYDVDEVNALLNMASRQDKVLEISETPSYDEVREKAAQMAWENFNELFIAEEEKIMNQLSAENRPKPAKGLKEFIRKETGQIKPKDKMVTEYNALTAAFKKAATNARIAYSTGKKEEIEKAKEQMRWLIKRRKSLKNVRDYFNLTDADFMKVTNRRNPALMDDDEYKRFLSDVEQKAIEQADNRQAKFELMVLVEEKRLKKVDNYRQAMQLPTIGKMTTKQLREFVELLEPFQYDDVFLTKRELETVDKTSLKGIRTWREAREKFMAEVNAARMKAGKKPFDFIGNIKVDEDTVTKINKERKEPFKNINELLKDKKSRNRIIDAANEKLIKEGKSAIEYIDPIHVAWNALEKGDTYLREQDPFFERFVTDIDTALIKSEMDYHDIESKTYLLAKKAEKSRKLGLIEKMIPQDELVFNFLEAPPEDKESILRQMTKEQIDFANFLKKFFADAESYLLSAGVIEQGKSEYITHIRKTFMENMRDTSVRDAILNVFKSYNEDAIVFNILDDTGKILPLEKFIPYSLHRSGELEPTKNVVRAFLTYARVLERKKAFDSIIPKWDIYAQSLTPTKYTPRGLEVDRSLKIFINQWINNKKGRKFNFGGFVKQGESKDLAIRAMRTFTTMLDLGFYVPAQVINIGGEQLTTLVPLGYKNYAKSIGLLRTAKGKRILKKYEFFTERSLWEEFTAPGKEIQERLMTGMFGIFHISNVAANKQFLLGSMTEEEWENETLSPERLTLIKLEMGRFRAIPSFKSVIGSTSVGSSVMQYKRWAIPGTRTMIKDALTMADLLRKKQFGEAVTVQEAREIYRIVGTTMAITTVLALCGSDDDDENYDNTFIGAMKTRAIREVYSLTQGMDPVFWLSWRTGSYLKQLATALDNLLTLEEYETKEGYKGVEQLKKAVTPGVARKLVDKEE
jgi:hypothetical protein